MTPGERVNYNEHRIVALENELKRAKTEIDLYIATAKGYREASRTLMHYFSLLRDGELCSVSKRVEIYERLEKLHDVFLQSWVRVDPPVCLPDEECEAHNEQIAHANDVALGLDNEGC